MSGRRIPVDVFQASDLSICTLHRCLRGWLIRSGGPEYDGLIRPMFAFDSIEDVAAFLVEHLSAEVRQ